MPNEEKNLDQVAHVAREGEAHRDAQESQDSLRDERGTQNDVHGEISEAAERNRDDIDLSGTSV